MLFIGCFVLLAMVSVSSAATLTVDRHGNGDHITIQDALFAADWGDEVVVLPGVYLENLVMVSGVHLTSLEGPAETIIDGQGTRCIEVPQCAPGTAISGLTLTNGGGEQGGGIWVFDNSAVEISGNIISNCKVRYEGAGIHVQRYSYASIHHNRFLNNSSPMAAAISVIVYSSVEIRDNEFVGNRSEIRAAAIGVHESHAEIVDNRLFDNVGGQTTGNVDFYKATGRVSNNVFVGNVGTEGGASCVAVRHGSSRVTIVRNIFAENTGGPALLTDACQSVSCNIFWENTEPHTGLCPPIGQEGNLQVDPVLCPDNRGYAEESSPCLTMRCGRIGLSRQPKNGN